MGAVPPTPAPGPVEHRSKEADVPNVVHHLRPLCNAYGRQSLARRLADLDRSGQYAMTPVSPELFDFQEGAAQWLAARFQVPAGFSLLEMAAGCGKTRALGAFLGLALPAAAQCLYLTQAGLVRQTCEELQRVFPRLVCFKAESSAELAEKARVPRYPYSVPREGVFVVNSALRRRDLEDIARHAWCVIVDEAHRASGVFLCTLAKSGGSSKMVLSSATPSASTSLSTLAVRAADEQHFVVLKNSSMAEALRMPRLVLVDRSYRSSVEPRLVAQVLDSINWSETNAPVTYFLVCLALWKSEPGEPLFLEKAAQTWTQICAALAARSWLAARRRLWHPAVYAAARDFSERLPTSAEGALLLRLLEPPAPPASAASAALSATLCTCCGLREAEVRCLQTALSSGLPTPQIPHTWGLDERPFVRAILRLPDARSVRLYRTSLRNEIVRAVWISSELTAAQRAKRVTLFVKPRENPAALALLLRTGFGSRGAAAAVAHIGAGELMRHIVSFVADRAMLICDARCGDVGYNLQMSTHILAPLLPRSAEEVQQLCGRVHRIRHGEQRPHVRIVCCPRRGTGEVFLLRHLCRSCDCAAC